jgi:hypothetical protein
MFWNFWTIFARYSNRYTNIPRKLSTISTLIKRDLAYDTKLSIIKLQIYYQMWLSARCQRILFMDKKDSTEGKTSPSSSQELFEQLFRDATIELKRVKGAKPAGEQAAPESELQQSQHVEKTPLIKKSAPKLAGPLPRKGRPLKAVPTVAPVIQKPVALAVRRNPQNDQSSFADASEDTPTPPRQDDSGFLRRRVKIERPETSHRSTADGAESTPPPSSTPKTARRKGKRSVAPKATLLVILLIVLAGSLLSYMGIIDISPVLDYFGFGLQQVTQSPVPKKQPAKPPEKAVPSPKPTQEKAPAPLPAPAEKTPAPVPKAESQVKPETPATSAQAGSTVERIEGKAPSTPAQEQPKPVEVSAKQEPHPAPVQAQPPARPIAPEVSPPQPPRIPQYPYSVYLGSFKDFETVKEVLLECQGKGLSAYWAMVDLGDKGVWFRFFAGYFRTKEEAERYIRDHKLKDATPGVTTYANLIGVYGTDKEVEDQKRALVSSGFYPYVIKAPDGKNLVYSGAFDRKEYAEKERGTLASKGFQSAVVER